MKSTEEIRKELRNYINRRKKKCKTPQERNNLTNLAQEHINKKYGKDWRGKDIQHTTKVTEPSIYDEHIHGQHWMD